MMELLTNRFGKGPVGHITGKRPRLTFRQSATVATPPLLIVAMVPAFQSLVSLLGWPAGYLAGMAIYWVGWCTILPAFLLGGVRPLLELFKEGNPGINKLPARVQLALWWPLVFPLA